MIDTFLDNQVLIVFENSYCSYVSFAPNAEKSVTQSVTGSE